MKDKILDYPSFIDKSTILYIAENTHEDDFDEEVFKEWLLIKDIEHKTSPNVYIKSCFKKELEKGTFRPRAKVSYVPNTQVLINEMRDRGVCVLADESVWLSVVWEHLVNMKDIDIKVCQDLNHKILNYMDKTKSFDEYKRLLMNSKTLKQYNINWALLEEKTKMKILGWDNYLKDLLESEG